MHPIVALGCGLVGEYVIHRLADDGHEVTAVDIRIPKSIKLRKEIISIEQDAKRFIDSLKHPTVVVNMLPGRIGHSIRKPLVEGGHLIVDLAFTEENPQVFDEDAKKYNSTMIWDIGIAPGLSNMLLAQAQRELGALEEVTIHVGGNPTTPDNEWSYMAPFSPSDVIEEYTRPARIVRNGEVVTEPALTERHRIDVEGTNGMDAFLTDGLRSVLQTIEATNMAEYTVRWPQHIDRWISEGDSTPEEDLLSAWKFDNERPEFTWMKVRCQSNQSLREWTVIDYGKDGDGSMARTTGLVTYALASLFATEGPEACGLASGVHPPENVNQETLESVLEVFEKHGISIS
tara:strand:- start:357 stop:1391 length:1035 start_codon:yes stop_codon:yes gene_type:complete